ncbi:aldolase/citrate lyase family protein [Ensifer sp. MJa1]|uniref:aldolase/citrate lyase family protein n=1 Tax=Ensifer sp. MJa1 TaxID=2919888 RepID=UPI00300B96D1
MSVNRLQTIKPLLLADSAATNVDVAALNRFAGVVVGIDCSKEVLVGMAQLAGRSFSLLARVAPAGQLSEEHLNRLLDSGVDGLVLSECAGRSDIQRLDVMLQVAEASMGIASNRIRLYAEFGGSAGGLLSAHTLAGSSKRLDALIFDGTALATLVGCKEPTAETHERTAAPILAARAAVVLKASHAGIPAYEVLPTSCDNETRTRQALAKSRDNGFASVGCHSIEQATFLSDV